MYKWSIILVSLVGLYLVIAYILYEKDPNAFDVVVSVEISESESKDFQYDFDSTHKEVLAYLNEVKKEIEWHNDYPRLSATGKKPVEWKLSSAYTEQSAGPYVVMKVEGGYNLRNRDSANLISQEPDELGDVIHIACGGLWNSLNLVVVSSD